MIPHCPNDGGMSRPRRLARAGRPGGLTPNPDRTRVIPWTCRPSGASGRGSDLDRPRDLMRAPPKASVTVASQRQRVRHRLPLRGKERTCRSRPRKPAPSSEASALVRTCTVHCAAVVDRNRTRHRPRGLLDDPRRPDRASPTRTPRPDRSPADCDQRNHRWKVDEPDTAVDRYGALPSVEISDRFLPGATGTARTRRRSRRLPGAGGPVCGRGSATTGPSGTPPGCVRTSSILHEAGGPRWQRRRPGRHADCRRAA